jgi:hypothetical protein
MARSYFRQPARLASLNGEPCRVSAMVVEWSTPVIGLSLINSIIRLIGRRR